MTRAAPTSSSNGVGAGRFASGSNDAYGSLVAQSLLSVGSAEIA